MKNFIIRKKQLLSTSFLLLCIFSPLINFGQNYDGICPPNANSYTDCDCAPDGITNFMAAEIKDTSDYSNVIHIDPTANGQNEDGSYEHPFNSWFDITWESNTAYVQKRGTTFSTTQTITITVGHVMLGAYGNGEKPIIISTSSNNTVNVQNAYVLLRDLSLQAPNMTGGTILYLRGPSNHAIVYQCDICNGGWEGLMAYSDYGHIIGCNIYNIQQDAIWIAETPYFEIAYNNIYDFNQVWYPGAPESVSGGDGIQGGFDIEQIWIHHNTIDHGNSGNKATIFIKSGTDSNHPDWSDCTRAIVEFNTLISPKVTAEGGAAINFHLGANHTIRYNKIYAAEVIEGSYPDSLSIGLYLTSDNDSVYGNLFKDFNRAIHSSKNIFYANNTFYNTQNYILYGSSSSIFYNNIFDKNLFSNGLSTSEEENNLFVTGTPWGNSFNGNPGYIDAENNDFHLESSSDAIDAGINWSQYKFDIDTNQIVNKPDIGAYEYIGETGSSSLFNNSGTNSVIVYPNPSNKIINISGIDQIKEIKILNAQGNTVYQNEPVSTNLKINVNNLNIGLYLIVIVMSKKDKCYIAKFIKS